jgi:hypothetical protein
MLQGFKRFDKIDWFFFVFLGICNLYLMFITVLAVIAGAPIYISVVLVIATVGVLLGYINAVRYAMGY